MYGYYIPCKIVAVRSLRYIQLTGKTHLMLAIQWNHWISNVCNKGS